MTKHFEHYWVAFCSKNVTEKNRIHVNIRIGSANVDVIFNNFVKFVFAFVLLSAYFIIQKNN